MPTLASGGGPAINTGNAAWDQGLGSIFGAMSEGPAKIAQAGYYGAEQRYKQLQSSQLQEQIAAGHQFLGMTTGQMPGKPQYRTDPATGQNILADTAAIWGGTAPPPAAPAAPPGGQAPISSAVVGPPPGPAPGPVPAPAPASGFQGGGEGGGAGPPAVAPIANLIADSVSKASTSNSGPPLPPASPPAPGLPPAPNTTATDGSTPADNGAGILHPGSFTPAGGGVKASGPAAPDGSPAPTAVNLGQLVALGVMKGMPAADAMGVARTVVAGWVKNGQMDQQHADDMLADLGETAMRVANLNNAGALQRTNVEQAGATTRTGMEQAGATTRTGMTEAGATTRAGMTIEEADKARGDALVDTVDDQGNKTLTPRRDLKPGQPGYDPTLANTRLSAAVASVTTQPDGPGTGTYSEQTSTAQKNRSRLYQQTPEQQQGAMGNYVDRNNPTELLPRTAAQAQKEGLVAAPKSMEEWNALAASASANAKSPEEAQAIRDKVMAFAVASTPKSTTPNESVQNANIVDQRLSLHAPVPVRSGILGTGVGAGAATNMLPAGSSPELGDTLQNLTDQYFTRSPDPSIRGNRVAAADAAVQQLIRQGRINPSQSRDTGLTPGANAPSTIMKPVYNPAAKTIEQKPHFRVDLLDPNTKQPVAPGTASNIPMDAPPLSSAVAPTAVKGQPPAGALGPAPPGAADGTTGTTSTGQRGVVRGGWVFPAASAAAPGPGGGG